MPEGVEQVRAEDTDGDCVLVVKGSRMPKGPEHGEEFAVTLRTGNVFADVGLRDSEEGLLKAAVMIQLAQLIKERRLTDADAAG